MFRSRWVLVLVCVAAGGASRAAAQLDGGTQTHDAGDSAVSPRDADLPDAGPPALSPPALTAFVEADYPAAARDAGREAAVELVLTIDAQGHVTDAQVATPVGEGFDEAALAAARQFVFEPARRFGAPVAARIRYRYVFELHAAPTNQTAAAGSTAPPEPPPGRLEGNVLDREEGAAVAGAELIVTSLDDPNAGAHRVVSGADGRFDAGELAAGRYHVRARADAMRDFDSDERVEPGQATTVTYRLELARDREAFGATARVDPPPREVTRRTIETEELMRIPGTRGDPLRAIEILPGVGRPPFGSGQLIIRGSSPRDSEVFIENTDTPALYHFGSLTSVFNGQLLDRIDFYPGNFSARYGRRMGGIVDVGVRDPRTDRWHAVADVNLIDASVMAEGPIGSRGALSLSIRRSYIDFWFQNVLPKNIFGSIIAAPVYYDYQLVATYRLTDRDRLRLLVFGSSDRFSVVFTDPSDQDPSVRGNLDLSTQFHRGQLEWRHQWSADVDQLTQLNVGYTALRFGLGQAFKLDLSGPRVDLRSEVTARISPRVRLIAGLDVFSTPNFGVSYIGPQIQQDEGNPGGAPFGSQPTFALNRRVDIVQPAVYVEASFRPTDALTIIAGTRLDYFSEIGRWSIDPRLVARYALNEHTTVKAGVGLFSQPPEFQESTTGLGNPNLEPNHSVHVSAGVDHQFDQTFSIGVEGFYKYLWNRVVGTTGSEAPFFVNDGDGRIYGLEVSGRARPTGRFFGFLSYTLSRSERRDHAGAWRLFDFDQTHIFTVAGVYRLGRGWEIGATFRYVTGNPLTPVTSSIYNSNTDLYTPIYGALNSARNSDFHRLDLRIEKQWRFQSWSLALYLDLQNVYNRRNPEAIQYNYDYSQNRIIGGLPIIPSLGVRGEL